MRRLFKWLAVITLILGAAFLIFRTPDTDPTEMRAKYGAAPSQFVDLGGGLTVHLRDEGPRDALPIVLLHGSNDDLHTWDAWAATLSKQYRVVRFDTIGHGLTGAAPDKVYTPQAMADLVGKVADKLGLPKFVLGGNSMGGGISVLYATQHPERLAGLVLVDAGGAPKKAAEPGNIGFKIAAMPGINQLMLHITPRSIIEKSLRQSVTNADFVTPAVVDRYWELLRYPGNRAATLQRFTASRNAFDRNLIAGIKVPTLILWGEEDKLIGVDGARWYAEAIAGSTLKIYPKIGHLPQLEHPATSAADIATFLASLKPG